MTNILTAILLGCAVFGIAALTVAAILWPRACDVEGEL